MKRFILPLAILSFSAVLSSQAPAKADHVSDVLRDTNNLIEGYGQYEQHVLTPAIGAHEQRLDYLQGLCYQGNTSACSQFNTMVQGESRRLDDALEYIRTRPNPYLGGY